MTRNREMGEEEHEGRDNPSPQPSFDSAQDVPFDTPLRGTQDASPARGEVEGYQRARGAIPWEEGDELPEETIARMRGRDPDYEKALERIKELEAHVAAWVSLLRTLFNEVDGYQYQLGNEELRDLLEEVRLALQSAPVVTYQKVVRMERDPVEPDELVGWSDEDDGDYTIYVLGDRQKLEEGKEYRVLFYNCWEDDGE